MSYGESANELHSRAPGSGGFVPNSLVPKSRAISSRPRAPNADARFPSPRTRAPMARSRGCRRRPPARYGASGRWGGAGGCARRGMLRGTAPRRRRRGPSVARFGERNGASTLGRLLGSSHIRVRAAVGCQAAGCGDRASRRDRHEGATMLLAPGDARNPRGTRGSSRGIARGHTCAGTLRAQNSSRLASTEPGPARSPGCEALRPL